MKKEAAAIGGYSSLREGILLCSGLVFMSDYDPIRA